jgi:hypothetical protein
VAAVTTVLATLALAGPASANPPTGYGFDDTAHIIVGGGSDTTYKAMVGIGDLYGASGLSGCAHITAAGGTANSCNPTGSPETSNLGNWQGDTIAQANPVGSGTGIGSLNGNAGSGGVYQGTVNPVPNGDTCVNSTTGPNPDFARSSRSEKLSGGSAPCTNELTADTFWGYGQDGVEVIGFNTHGNLLNNLGGSALTADQIFHIWDCSGGTGSGTSRTDGGVGAANAPARVDGTGGAGTVTVTNGSSLVNDNKIKTSDAGLIVTGTGIPNDTFVSNVVAGTSFNLSSSATSEVDVNATAAGTSATINFVEVLNGSATVLDPRIASTDQGRPVTGTGIPANTFVGTVTPGVSFLLSSSNSSQINVNATANGTTVTTTNARIRWSDIIPSLPGGVGGPNDADVVPWQMNTASGTQATFQSWIQAHASGVPASWSTNGQACDRKLASGNVPLENDIKPLINDPQPNLGTGASNDNPENWMWWGSFGVFSAFPFTSSFTRGTLYTAKAAPVQGTLPSSAGIIGDTYPIGRTLFHVTRKEDADCAKTGPNCDFTNNPGPVIGAGPGTDLNVTGGSSGISGAVREFTRFLCRGSLTQYGKDPFTGTNFSSEITTALNNAGFTVVPAGLRQNGSRCAVHS